MIIKMTTKLNEFARIYVGSAGKKNTTPVPEAYLKKEGDIIVNTVKLKDIVLIEKEQEGQPVPNRCLIIRCDRAKAIPGFILSEMLSDEGCEKRRKICRDAVLPHQKAKKYAELKFKLPPLEMQEFIYSLQNSVEAAVKRE